MQNEDNRPPRRFSVPAEWGIPQPDYFPHITDEERDAKMAALRVRNHQWIQQGPDVICTECVDSHGFFIGTNKMIVGTDKNGMPIIKDLTLSE